MKEINVSDSIDLDNGIKIITYNLGNCMYVKNNDYCFRKKYVDNLNNQIKTIKNIDADIILFQEMTKLSPVNWFINPYKKNTKTIILL